MRLFVVTALAVLHFFPQSSYQLTLQCNFRLQQYANSNKYTCVAEHFESTFKDRIVGNVTGEHSRGKSNRDVKMLFMEKQNCHYIPRKLAEFFPNLEVLCIRRSNIQHLLMGDLDGLQQLQALDLSFNPIEKIGEYFFIGRTMLREISFFECHLKKVDPSALDMLTNLKSANFRLNECIDLEGGQYDTSVERLVAQVYKHCNRGGVQTRPIGGGECRVKSGRSYVNYILLLLVALSMLLTLTLSTVLLRTHRKLKLQLSSWSEAVNEFVVKESDDN